jgi:hypothetical protein
MLRIINRNMDSERVLVERMSEHDAKVCFSELREKLLMQAISNIGEWRLYFLLKKRLHAD